MFPLGQNLLSDGFAGETCMKLTSEDRVQLFGIMNAITKMRKLVPGHFQFNDSKMGSKDYFKSIKG